MMETKLWIALCALLLINLGSAKHDGDHDPKVQATKSVPGSSLDPISHVTTAPSPNGSAINTSSTVNSRLSSNTTTEGKPISLIPEPKKDNDTNSVPLPEAAVPEGNTNLTNPLASQPPIPTSGSHAPTSHIRPTYTAHSALVDTPTTAPPISKSQHAALPFTDSITNQPPHPKTHSSTSVPHATTSEPTKHETTTITTIALSSSTSSTNSSSQEPPSSQSPMLTSPQKTLQTDRHPETSSAAHPESTVNPQSSPSAQAKVNPQANTPSQLNVGGDTTMVHESPTLDPLLAGLVSAFIITAVIITLLLFIKLRRRDNRPEFRRLQDLPMDDMMEDTPLSMYSY